MHCKFIGCKMNISSFMRMKILQTFLVIFVCIVSCDKNPLLSTDKYVRARIKLEKIEIKSLNETVYFIDYQGVRFVMLNGNEKLQEQAEWLDRVLSQNSQDWTIAAIHQPVYSTARKRDNTLLQDLFVPIFDKYSVDLVLQGHDHTYSRTFKLRNGKRVEDNESETVYVISVSGPKNYSVNKRYEHLMEKMETGRQLFQVISVNKNRLQYESYNALGELYDSFELKK